MFVLEFDLDDIAGDLLLRYRQYPGERKHLAALECGAHFLVLACMPCAVVIGITQRYTLGENCSASGGQNQFVRFHGAMMPSRN